MNETGAKRILIVKLSSLGDVFMALPHIDAILAHHPDDAVWMMTSPAYAPLFDGHPRLNVLVLDRSAVFGGRGTLARMAAVRRQAFDVIYDLQGNRTSRMLIRMSGAERRVGKRGKSVYNVYPAHDDPEKHIFERLDTILSAAGLPAVQPVCRLYPGETDIDAVERYKRDRGLVDGRYALLHAGASPEWHSKRWPLAHFNALAAAFERAGLACIWIGGPEDRPLISQAAGITGIDAIGTFTFLQLYLLGRGAACAVTNDSGPMHILTASGIPVYSFFGPTDWRKHHGAGQQKRVLRRDMACSPCYKKICPPENRHACLDLIAPGDVFNRINTDIIQKR